MRCVRRAAKIIENVRGAKAMYKSLLIPVDFDHHEINANALRAAGCLADEGSATTLVHVVPDIPGYAANYLPEGTLEKRHDEAQAELERMAADAGIVGADAVVMTAGRPSNAILEAAEKIKADCIVIASHHPGVQDYFLGSTASRVVRHADCSVMVIR